MKKHQIKISIKQLLLVFILLLNFSIKASDTINYSANKKVELILVVVDDTNNIHLRSINVKKDKPFIIKPDSINKINFYVRHKGKYYPSSVINNEQLIELEEIKITIRRKKIYINYSFGSYGVLFELKV